MNRTERKIQIYAEASNETLTYLEKITKDKVSEFGTHKDHSVLGGRGAMKHLMTTADEELILIQKEIAKRRK